MKSYSIERARHFVLRATTGDVIPDDLARILADERATCGWVRASGALVDVELRAWDPGIGAPGEPRRLAGPIQALAIEGSLGLDRGDPSLGLRAVLARETDRGMETIAGEIVRARVVALEAFVTAFEDLALGRALDPKANVVLFGEPADARYRPDDERAAAPTSLAARSGNTAPVPAPAPSSTWNDVIVASAEQERPAANRGAVGGAIPARLAARPQKSEDEGQMPEAGDVVEHFAFGRSEVIKSDGDRLHLRVDKDGRVKEIALEMLRVTPLEPAGTQRRFKLDRKM